MNAIDLLYPNLPDLSKLVNTKDYSESINRHKNRFRQKHECIKST